MAPVLNQIQILTKKIIAVLKENQVEKSKTKKAIKTSV